MVIILITPVSHCMTSSMRVIREMMFSLLQPRMKR